jgi:lipopolysaccharide export system protein LptA
MKNMLNLFQHIFLIVICTTIYAQTPTNTGEKKEIEILNSDKLSYTNSNGYEVQYLVGNVKLKHINTYIECDSAIVMKSVNKIYAFGNVYINHNGNIDIHSDQLYYYGDIKTAELKQNVTLSDGKMRLEAPEVSYDMNSSIGTYNNSGTVFSDESVIKSQKGTYYNNTSDIFFRDNVVVTNPKFTLTSDTLQYNSSSDKATFYSLTEIKGDGSTILCYTGHYDTKRGLADFGYNTKIINESQTLYGDSIYYDRNLEYAKTFKHFTMVDDSNKVMIIGTRANYKEENKYLFAFQRPLLINYSDADTLYLRADTLISYNKEISDKRFFTAYRNVRMYRKDLQARSDSLYYSFEDSTFRMFYKPILWSDEMQSTADTIFILTKKNKADQLHYYSNAYIIMQTVKNYFDQIKGNKIIGYLKENELEYMDVKGSAESLYYGKNDNNKILGQNNATSSYMKIYFSDKKVDIVKFINKPIAIFTPIRQVTEEQKLLKNFNWQESLRPKNKDDL